MNFMTMGFLIVFSLSGCMLPKKNDPQAPSPDTPAGEGQNKPLLTPTSNTAATFLEPQFSDPQPASPIFSEFRMPVPLFLTGSSEKTLDQIKKSPQALGMDTQFYFNNLSSIIKEDFASIHFTIKTDCVLKGQQHFKQEFQKPLQAHLSVMELLPQKLLTSFSEEQTAVCSFSFQGKNKADTMYFFLNLASLPVSIQEAYQMEVVGPAGKALDSKFASIRLNNHQNHWLHLEPLSLPLEVRMVCGKQEWLLKTAADTRFVPLWGFNLTSPYHSPRKVKTEPSSADTSREQGEGGVPFQTRKKCRLLAYDNQQTVKALSLHFEMVPELLSPEITVQTLPEKTKHLAIAIRQNMSLEHDRQVPLLLYQYQFVNSQDYPVHILIAEPRPGEYTSKEYVRDLYFLYHDLKHKVGFFRIETMVLAIEDLFQRIQKAYPDRDLHLTSEGILFTIPPKTTIHIPIHLNKDFRMCRANRRGSGQHTIRAIGGFTYPLPMKFYQLISGSPEALNRKENIRKPLSYDTSKVLAYPHKNWFYSKKIDDETTGPHWGQTIAIYKTCYGKVQLTKRKPLLHIYMNIARRHVSDMEFKLIEPDDPFFFSTINTKSEKLNSLHSFMKEMY